MSTVTGRIVENEVFNVSSGGTATETIVNYGGQMIVSSGGTAVQTILMSGTISGSCGSNLTWELNTASGTLWIRGTGEMDNYSYSATSGTVSPFMKNTQIKNIIIEEGVTSVGNFAFYNCTAATSVSLPESLTAIGENAFYQCRALKTLYVPDNVTRIGKNAFVRCENLAEVRLSENLTELGDRAFGGCYALKGIVLPEGLTKLSNSLFETCSAMTEVTIPSSIVSIGNNVFQHCSKLDSVVVPSGVTTIGDYAFADCTALTKIEFPASVSKIGENAFLNSSKVEIHGTDGIYAKSFAEKKGIVFIAGPMSTDPWTPPPISPSPPPVVPTTPTPPGVMYVSSGGTATNTAVNKDGTLFVYDGGTATNTAVNSGGALYVSSGGMLKGSLTIESGATVSAASGAIIDFTLSEQANPEKALINHYDYLQGAENATYTITVKENLDIGPYALAGFASGFNQTITVKTTTGTVMGSFTVGSYFDYRSLTYLLLVAEDTLVLSVVGLPIGITPSVTKLETEVSGTQATFDWSGDATVAWADGYDIVLGCDAGEIALEGIRATGVETFQTPTGELSLAVKPAQSNQWTHIEGPAVIQEETNEAPQVVTAETNGFADVMFGRATGVWNANYRAGHVSLPGEKAKLKGRNQIGDLFFGSDDASILLLTDDANGDVFFLDDIYSAFPEGMDAPARLAKIDEIQAGAGTDVVDLTSTRFEYVGGGLTVHGGAGDDVIWANSGDNLLFGDGGNDRIVGAAGNDVIAGGAGADSMHGLCGDDLFVFGGNWGSDTVEQLADGKVTLWFAEGDASKWDAATLTYSDGANSVKVTGVTDVTLKFGDDGSQQYQDLLAAGAFADSTSENIFTDKNKGMLA